MSILNGNSAIQLKPRHKKWKKKLFCVFFFEKKSTFDLITITSRRIVFIIEVDSQIPSKLLIKNT